MLGKTTIQFLIWFVLISELTFTESSKFFPRRGLVSYVETLFESNSQSNDTLLSQNTDFLISEQFKGNYQSQQSTRLFDYLDVNQGELEVLFLNDPLKQTSSLNTMELFLFNPKYHDLKVMVIEFDIKQLNDQNMWTENNTKIKLQKFSKGRSTSDEQTVQNVSYKIQILNIDQQDASQASILITAEGPNFKFTATLTYYSGFLSALGYSLYTTLIVGLQIFCAVSILKQIDQANPLILSKMSLFTLSICNIEDFYYTMLHIEYIMSSRTAYLLFVLPSLAYLVIFVIFDMKMLFLVWRSQHMRNAQNPQALRKKLTIFYIEFYLGLFIYLTLNYFFEYYSWLIFIQHLILVPQIVHNVRKGNNPGFSPFYAIGFLGLRYLIPLYQRGCPQNHFLLEPMPDLVFILGVLYVIEILILYFQSKFGPRFFLPQILLPNIHNYNVKLKKNEENQDIECTICLLNIFSPEFNSRETVLINQSMTENLLDQIHIMKTPCNHYFHSECLNRWMDVKLQCPTCRKPLPAL